MTDEEQLLARLRAGEQKAFEQLVRQYQGAMRAVATAIVGSSSADEVVQDSWLAVVRHIDGFAERASLKTWLLTITANTAKTRLKKQRREVFIDDISGPHGTLGPDRFQPNGHWQQKLPAWHSDSPEALLDAQELRDCLDHTLNTLSELQRSVLLLRDRQCLELAEICNLLGISHSNVRVLLHRARLSVFATLEHFEVTGEC
ncbi:MAG: RNA polymerase sigma factor [Halopseudomonas sp.]|uniref:RNA polymerase sigma factor n=1 Tax=Halopseudomonas sp. TaxID=2901191 RepID=UPI003002A510